MLGASLPTSLQKFQASNANLVFGFFIPRPPNADMYETESCSEASIIETMQPTLQKLARKSSIENIMQAVVTKIIVISGQ